MSKHCTEVGLELRRKKRFVLAMVGGLFVLGSPTVSHCVFHLHPLSLSGNAALLLWGAIVVGFACFFCALLGEALDTET